MGNDPRDRAEKLFGQNKMAAAAPLFENLLLETPGDNELRMKLGICLFRTQDFQAAEARFRAVSAAQNHNHMAWYYLGLTQERQGREDDARTSYRFALSIKPDFSEAQQKLGGESSRPLAPNKASKSLPGEALEEADLARGIFTQQKSRFIFRCEQVAYFFLGLLFIGGVTGSMAAFVTSIVTNDNDAALVIGIGVGAVVGLVSGIIKAGNVSRVV